MENLWHTYPFGRYFKSLDKVPVNAVQTSNALVGEDGEQRWGHVDVSPAGTTGAPVGDEGLGGDTVV